MSPVKQIANFKVLIKLVEILPSLICIVTDRLQLGIKFEDHNSYKILFDITILTSKFC